VDAIVACIGRFVSGLPADLAEEVRESGMCLTGGGALLAGMLERLVARPRRPSGARPIRCGR
jgi:actin-like ATPase involved in cell morphogenesis